MRLEDNQRDFVNAFTLNWSDLGLVYACPPPRLAVPMIRQLIRQKARGIVILPAWTSGRYWPIISSGGKVGRKFIRFAKRFRPTLRKGEDVKSNTFSGRPAFDFLALMVDGGVSEPLARNESILLAF